MALFAIVAAPTLSEAIMEALQTAGLITLGCVTMMSLFYGEIVLLKRG
jgi:hypothetical protein